MTDSVIDYYQKYLKYKMKYLKLKMHQIGSSELRISIQNKSPYTWLDWIEDGTKKYEGRLNRGIFSRLKIGDKIIFYDKSSKKEVNIVVTDLKYYPNFVDAFNELGSELVPIPKINASEVGKLYGKYFTPQEIKKSGVVAIGVKIAIGT